MKGTAKKVLVSKKGGGLSHPRAERRSFYSYFEGMRRERPSKGEEGGCRRERNRPLRSVRPKYVGNISKDRKGRKKKEGEGPPREEKNHSYRRQFSRQEAGKKDGGLRSVRRERKGLRGENYSRGPSLVRRQKVLVNWLALREVDSEKEGARENSEPPEREKREDVA